MKKYIFIWILTFILLCSFVFAVPPSGELYYDFNTGSGIIAFDQWGVKDGKMSGATWSSDVPVYNTTGSGAPFSAEFTPLTNFIRNKTVSLGVTNYSMSWWAKSDIAQVSGTFRDYVRWGDENATNMFAYFSGYVSSTNSRYRVYDAGFTTSVDIDYGVALGTSWHLLTLTVDDSNDEFSLYVDGSHISTIAMTFVPRVAVKRLVIGNRDTSYVGGGANEGFDGTIDQFKIFNKVLNSVDVANLYNFGSIEGAPVVIANFTITATDTFDGSPLVNLTANITFNNGSSQVYTNSTGNFILTDIQNNETVFLNISLSSTGYFDRIILNQNSSINLVTTLNQTKTTFNASDVFGDPVLIGNITINAETHDLDYIWPLKAGSYNITFSGLQYFPITQEITVVALSVSTHNITGVYDTNFTINAIDFIGNGTINSFNVTIEQVNVNFSSFNFTSSGNISFSLLRSRNYNVTVRSDGYLINNNSDYNISLNLTAVMHSAFSHSTFIDSNTSLGIINRSITVTYPGGFQLPLTTDENGTVEWITILNGVELFGEYNITFDSQDGYASPQSFLENITALNAPLNTTYFISPSILNITIRDQATGDLINQSTIVTIVGIGQFNVTGGNLVIQNGSIAAGSYTLYALATGYVIGQTVFDYDAREVENINVFLIQSNASNTGTIGVTIFDEGFNTQLGSDVRLLQYFADVDSFVQVDQCFSNSNGECFFGVQLGTTLYKVSSTKTVADEFLQGVSSTDGEIFFIDNYAIDIHMFNDLVYQAPDLLGFSITASNTTLIKNISYLTGSWNDIYGVFNQVCIRYNYINNSVVFPLAGGLNCASGISGEINVFGGYNLTLILETSSVLVELFVNESNGNEVVYWSEIYLASKSFQEQAGDLAPYLIIILFTSILALALYLKNIYIFGFGTIIASLLSRRFLPIFFTWEAVTVMIILSFVLFYLARKKEGNIEV